MDLPLTLFRALSDPTRLRILALLRKMELSVGELAQVLVQSQPRISRHIKILADARLIERRKEGAWVFLSLGEPALIRPLLSALDAWMAESPRDPWAVADEARLSAVRADRARAAEAYFNAHAGSWDEMRALHVGDAEVEAAILGLLRDAQLGRLADIGTGTGRMLELLAPLARSAIGLDRSPEMLRVARAKLAAAELAHAELRQGDMSALDLPDGCADTVILHQVLHYSETPEIALGQAARILSPGGRLLIADFAPHEREDLRSRHAHARLGFSDEQMTSWFTAAALETEATQALPGAELTVKLWLARKRGA